MSGEQRVTLTITPVTEGDVQDFIDAWRERHGRKHLIHVIASQPAGTHLRDAPTEKPAREVWCGSCACDVPLRSDGTYMAHRGLETPICPGSHTTPPVRQAGP